MSDTNRLLEKSRALIWDLLDDQISDADFVQLESLLRDNDQVRQIYIQCVQMHVDLHELFKAKRPAAFKSDSPALSAGIPLDFDLPGGGAFAAEVV